jgi:hypothetical protein
MRSLALTGPRTLFLSLISFETPEFGSFTKFIVSGNK